MLVAVPPFTTSWKPALLIVVLVAVPSTSCSPVARRRRPAFAGTRRVAHVFDVRYDAIDRELPALLKREKPDILVMFGVATRAHQVRVEERARNRVALFPDAGRFRPAMQTIVTGRDAVRNLLPLASLVKAARAAGADVTRSRNAGSTSG